MVEYLRLLCYSLRVVESKAETSFKPDESKIRIILADDHPLVRQALRSVLERQPDFEIVAEVNNGEAAVEAAVELAPNIVVMDISMPKLNGLEATRQIRRKCPSVDVLILSVHDDSEHILSILEAGAAGYLTKSVFGDEVIRAIRNIAAGETTLSPPVLQKVIKHAVRYTTKLSPLPGGEKIGIRELEILKLAARGLSNKDIADNLGLSVRTVKSYFAEIFTKFNVRNRTEAVITALRAHIVTLDDVE